MKITTISLILMLSVANFIHCQESQNEKKPVDKETIGNAEKVIGMHFDDAESDSLLENVNNFLENYEKNRQVDIKNSVAPAVKFNPVPGWMIIQKEQSKINWELPENVSLPENKSHLAFYSVPELASLIRS